MSRDRERENAERKLRSAAWRREGKCVDCGAEPHEPGGRKCALHRAAQIRFQRVRREIRAARKCASKNGRGAPRERATPWNAEKQRAYERAIDSIRCQTCGTAKEAGRPCGWCADYHRLCVVLRVHLAAAVAAEMSAAEREARRQRESREAERVGLELERRRRGTQYSA
jgi:hypothetical protein